MCSGVSSVGKHCNDSKVKMISSVKKDWKFIGLEMYRSVRRIVTEIAIFAYTSLSRLNLS